MTADSPDWERIGERAAEARQLAGYSQSQIADILGVNRVTIAYLETGERPVSMALLQRLSAEYHQPLSFFLGESVPSATRFAPLLFRAADEGQLSDATRSHITTFLRFLDCYVDVLHRIGEYRRPEPSPYSVVGRYTAAEDAQRKAEEVRDHLGLRLASIADLRTLLESLGVIIYYAPLGEDLSTTISGACLQHEELGTCILINSSISKGRQTFTLAHEFAHSLFHRQTNGGVGCRSTVRDAREVFADRFAAEFLVPMAALRRIMERARLPKKIADPTVIIQLQQYFNVSYQAMLVRLRQGQYLSQKEYEKLLGVSPAPLARHLGYDAGEPDMMSTTSLDRLPRDFIAVVREAHQRRLLSESEAAAALEIGQTPAEMVLTPPLSLGPDPALQQQMRLEWDTVAQATTR